MRNPVPVRLRSLHVSWEYGGTKGLRTSKWKKIAQKALKRDKYRCTQCGRSRADGGILSVDHIIPVSCGGKDELSNARTFCEWCHPAMEQAE
ncbi:HNH endonuclease [Candidatus Pacearchaeota archaeon]|nr:HNH endonuclease [Candidatus Pacearchaeota archaeon]